MQDFIRLTYKLLVREYNRHPGEVSSNINTNRDEQFINIKKTLFAMGGSSFLIGIHFQSDRYVLSMKPPPMHRKKSCLQR